MLSPPTPQYFLKVTGSLPKYVLLKCKIRHSFPYIKKKKCLNDKLLITNFIDKNVISAI